MTTINTGDVITIKAGSKILFFGKPVLNTMVCEVIEGVLEADMMVYASGGKIGQSELVGLDAKSIYKEMLK